jgi:hypothetical protein
MSETNTDLTVKISELSEANQVGDNDLLPVVQDGATKKIKKSVLALSVVAALGTAALYPVDHFAPFEAIGELSAQIEDKANEQNQRIDRIEYAVYLIRNNGISKAYRTKALMLADAANLPKDCVVNVVSDPANNSQTNDINGQYHYNGIDFFKLPDDLLLLVKSLTMQMGNEAKDYATGLFKLTVSFKPDLTTENLNTVLAEGYYRQTQDGNATTARNYPIGTNGAGILEVIPLNGLVIQEYTTWYNRKFRRTKYGTYDFTAWRETPNAADIAWVFKPNLGDENLDNVTDGGVYRQDNDAKATLAKNYPTGTNGAGILEVLNRGNMVIQEYTTWYNEKYWRVKYANYAFQPWRKVATQAQIDLAMMIKTSLLTTENLDDVLTTGYHRQQQDGNATTARNYPTSTNGAGIVSVVNHSGLVTQYYMTWYGRFFWRTKYGTYPFQKWQEVATVASINSPYKVKKIAWFGDSIVEGNNHPDRIATMLGATVYKFGFASHTMSKYPNSPLGRDKGSMYRFAHAINTGDWTDVVAGGEWVRDNLNDDNMPQINAMSSLDYSTVDYLIIAFGTNDIYSSTPLGDSYVADATGSTFIGATCYVIEQIQEKYPHIQIMFVTPTFRTRWFQTPNPDRPEQNSDTLPDPEGKPYIAYIDALLKMRDIYHIPVFDFYRTSGLNIRTWSHYLSDGVHPKENGIQLWTKKISAFLNTV